MSISDLSLEVLLVICNNLSDRDILSLSECSNNLRDIVYVVKFTTWANFAKIKNLPYFDSFIKVVYHSNHSSFPKSLRYLFWNNTMSLPLKLPMITHLILADGFQEEISQLPKSLTYLGLGYYYCRPLPQLPESLLHLEFCDSNDKCILTPYPIRSYNYEPALLPPPPYPFEREEKRRCPGTRFYTTRIHLVRGIHYEELLPQLPAKLKHLTLGYCHNQPLGRLPATLSYLKLGYYYNQILSQLPESLVYLALGPNYKRNLPEFPAGLTVYIKSS